MCKQYGCIYTSGLSSTALFMVKSVNSGFLLIQTSQSDTNNSQA